MDTDPAASMRCWAIDVELGSRVYKIPALPAADWWPVLASGDPASVLDLIVSDPVDPGNIDDQLLDGRLSSEELGTATLDAVEAAAGRSFHVAYVLASVAEMHWASINGQLAREGFRWDVMPLGAALDAIYSVVVRSFQEQEPLDRFLRLLEDDSLTTGRKRTVSGKAVDEFESLAGPRPTAGVRSSGEPSDSGRSRTRTRPRPLPRPGPSPEPKPRLVLPARSGRRASSSNR